MNQRNCPNCAAPYNVDLNKCPYCGTSYYDLSAIDFTSHEPFYLKIKTIINGQPCYITQLVRPRADMSMEFSSDTVDAHDCFGAKICTFTRGYGLTTHISFEAIPSPNHKNLCIIETE
jgi:hypothetical protein